MRIPSCYLGEFKVDRAQDRGRRPPITASTVDLDKIRPGMSAEELDKVRQEIARIASQTIRGV